ncbi:MAG: DUF1995 family protein [Phormidesmis sp.]
MSIPNTINIATEQAKLATKAALDAGISRLQIEMAIPELKHQPIAEQFLELFSDRQFKVLFPDAGAAALARRDWNEPDFTIRGLGELIQTVDPEDDLYFVINPSAVEVGKVEALCNEALDQPVVLLNPQLEDVAVVGIGYAARQLRERFLSQIETCYYVRPVDEGVVYRAYPGPWQIWREIAPDEYEHVQDLSNRPSSEDIDRILYGEGEPSGQSESQNSSQNSSQSSDRKGRKKGLLSELQQFLKALSQ